MKIGLMMFPTDKSIAPVELGREAEQRGFESLWFPEHSHIPSSRATPWGGREGAPALPEEYWRTYDQFVALAAVAAVTERLRIGTGICLVAQRDPIWLAKEVASLDLISDGRFDFGIGFGWNREEMRQHGVEPTTRRELVRDKIKLMKAIWTQDEAAYDGDMVSLEPTWSWPKPVQRPHPPVVLGGGAGPKLYDAVADYCDGWMPIGGRHSIEPGLEGIRKACEAAGRDPATVQLGMFGAKPDIAALNELAELGFRRAVLGLPSAPADEVMPVLERYTEEILPAFS
jgi:probable F420-dependent oxidoreductase